MRAESQVIQNGQPDSPSETQYGLAFLAKVFAIGTLPKKFPARPTSAADSQCLRFRYTRVTIRNPKL